MANLFEGITVTLCSQRTSEQTPIVALFEFAQSGVVACKIVMLRLWTKTKKKKALCCLIPRPGKRYLGYVKSPKNVMCCLV